MAVIANHTEL